MKIGILTYYGVHNHGAVLQANALKKVLSGNGHDVEFLTYKRNYDYIPVEKEKKYNISFASVKFFAKYLFKNGVSNVFYNYRKRRTLNNYRRESIPLGVRYSDFRGDAVVVGSDEVFSFEVGVNPFFYGHGIRAEKIISYAGCFGPTTLDELNEYNLSGMVASGFSRMNAVGVRDINSKIIADHLGNKESVLVCDPVILYGYDEESRMFKTPREKYILVYSYDKNMNAKEEVDLIKAYAKRNGLKVYSVGYYHKWCDKNINVTPNELLGYVKNSEMVITDTFHGSVLSIVCNTQFVAKLRGNSNKLGYLLNEYGIEDRIVESFDQLEEVAERDIDFRKVNEIIEDKRKASLAFLENALADN